MSPEAFLAVALNAFVLGRCLTRWAVFDHPFDLLWAAIGLIGLVVAWFSR